MFNKNKILILRAFAPTLREAATASMRETKNIPLISNAGKWQDSRLSI